MSDAVASPHANRLSPQETTAISRSPEAPSFTTQQPGHPPSLPARRLYALLGGDDAGN